MSKKNYEFVAGEGWLEITYDGAVIVVDVNDLVGYFERSEAEPMSQSERERTDVFTFDNPLDALKCALKGKI
jgi:hypothetical protein